MNYLGLLYATYFALFPSPFGNQLPSVVLAIAQCESGVQQFLPDGSPLWSPTDDVGIMQINAVNIPEAKKMGLDVVNSAEDNIKFGLLLYNQQGTRPWNGSKACWGKAYLAQAPPRQQVAEDL